MTPEVKEIIVREVSVCWPKRPDLVQIKHRIREATGHLADIGEVERAVQRIRIGKAVSLVLKQSTDEMVTAHVVADKVGQLLGESVTVAAVEKRLKFLKRRGRAVDESKRTKTGVFRIWGPVMARQHKGG